ncbi:unnamed protein product [Dovyalis caffra]|uniref:RING-type domain-containing protein n=1 Tax=Dovyalis caffra TaxID=77055 RepID=A0AAV1SGI3_9ROSI|nr:unnamed protein product [Dovyalis caffra]
MEGDQSRMLSGDEIDEALSRLSASRMSYLEEILRLNIRSLMRMSSMEETEREDTETLRESIENIRKSTKAFKEATAAILRKKVTIDGDHHDESLCSICIEDMAIGTVVVQLSCSHKFHKNCIAEWLKRKLTCPFCRFELSIK